MGVVGRLFLILTLFMGTHGSNNLCACICSVTSVVRPFMQSKVLYVRKLVKVGISAGNGNHL